MRIPSTVYNTCFPGASNSHPGAYVYIYMYIHVHMHNDKNNTHTHTHTMTYSFLFRGLTLRLLLLLSTPDPSPLSPPSSPSSAACLLATPDPSPLSPPSSPSSAACLLATALNFCCLYRVETFLNNQYYCKISHLFSHTTQHSQKTSYCMRKPLKCL